MYHFHCAYGGPEIEQANRRILSGTMSADGLTVRLVVDKLVRRHIHELQLPSLRDRTAQPLLYDIACQHTESDSKTLPHCDESHPHPIHHARVLPRLRGGKACGSHRAYPAQHRRLDC